MRPGELLSADYSFLNRELAMHYGIDGVEGNELAQGLTERNAARGLLANRFFLLHRPMGWIRRPSYEESGWRIF